MNFKAIKSEMNQQIGMLDKLYALLAEYKKSDGPQDKAKQLEDYVGEMRLACEAAIEMAEFLDKKELTEKAKIADKPKKELEDDDLSFLD